MTDRVNLPFIILLNLVQLLFKLGCLRSFNNSNCQNIEVCARDVCGSFMPASGNKKLLYTKQLL